MEARRERGDFAVRGLALIEEDVYSESDEARMARSRATAVKVIVLARIYFDCHSRNKIARLWTT